MVPLHIHTHYSFLDGLLRPQELVDFAVANDLPAVGITDHGELGGILDLFRCCAGTGVKPIFGCEFYFSPDIGKRGERDYSHLSVWAQSWEGLQRMMRLSSRAYLEGFYYKPRIDWRLLEEEGTQGLIAGSGCIEGLIPRAFLRKDPESLKDSCSRLLETFPGRFYLEIMPNSLESQVLVNRKIVRLAERTGIPLLMTTDSHYPRQEDFQSHEVLLAIQTKKTIHDPDRLSFGVPDFFLMDSEDAFKRLSWMAPEVIQRAIDNSYLLASQCHPIVPSGGKACIPQICEDPGSELSRLCEREFGSKCGSDPDGIYRERLDRELQAIRNLEFESYFLVVADYIRWARNQGILVGGGRGSSAGSLVSFLLGITSMDPIKYGLWFERFLNPGRKKLPDIDTDFQASRRDEVKHYLVGRFGAEKIATIGTFSRLRWKAALRDVFRAMGLEGVGDVISGVEAVVRGAENPPDTGILQWILENPNLRGNMDLNPQGYFAAFSSAAHLEDVIRQSGQHASGMVIGAQNLSDILPLRIRKKDNLVSTQFDQGGVEELGFLKVDLLGLRTLDTLQRARDLVEQNFQIQVDLDNLDLNDEKVWADISSGNGVGLFQLDTGNMSEITRRVCPRSLEELSDVIALYRPGPLGSGLVESYLRRRNGEEEVEFLDPRMESILAGTQGAIVYQEQVILICVELAGYSPAEADQVRQILGKGTVAQLDREEDRFVGGCGERGIEEELAREIFREFRSFGSYSFNRAHSVSYAWLSFQTAWFRAHYPTEFLIALLDTDPSNVAAYVREAARRGISLLPPSVNLSGVSYSWEKGAIREGLRTKWISEKGIREIAGKAPYSSLADFLERTDSRTIGKRVVESLIAIGALSEFGRPDEVRGQYWRLRGQESPKGFQEPWESLREAALSCSLCPLSSGRTQVVFGTGATNPPVDLVIIGRDPGREEDEQGIPFVGEAGRILHRALKRANLIHFEIYISNISKCRPAGNRFPGYAIAKTCSEHWLSRELELLRPRVILTLGNEAMKIIVGEDGITRNRGLWRTYGNELFSCRVMSCVHPAALLHDMEKGVAYLKDFLRDLSLVRQELEQYQDEKGGEGKKDGL